MPKSSWALVSVLGLACASSGQPGASSARASNALAYSMPQTNPLTYVAADSAQISMDVAGTSVQVAVQAESTMQLQFAAAAGGMSATLTFLTLSGQFTNSMGPSTSIGDADKPGPTRLSVSPRGEIEILERPPLTAAFQQVLGSEGMFQRLFTRLPGRPISVGDEWVDTVTINDEASGMTNTVHMVIRSTLAGDTTVSGRQFRLIRSEASANTVVAGNVEGMEIRQNLTGTINSTSLWDPARGILVERTETQSSSGTMDMPTMNLSGIPVSANGRSVLRLRN